MAAPLVFRLLTAAGKLVLTYSKKKADDVIKQGGKKITKAESNKIISPKHKRYNVRTHNFSGVARPKKNKGDIVKKFKGGLMVKPKRAKGGY